MNEYYGYQPNYSYYKDQRANSMRVLNDNPSLFSSTEGYTKGNMFASTYTPYKNYKPQVLRASNEQEQLFLKMSENDFAAHDLNLFLDLHPQDGNALELFNHYRVESNKLLMEYEDKYGPIGIDSNTLTASPFMWETKPFPWNEGGL